MNIKSIIRTGLGLSLGLSMVASAYAASYQYRVYLPGYIAPAPVVPAAPPPPPVENVTVALAGLTLPPATRTKAYSHDLAGQLTVTGASNFVASEVLWSAIAQDLPPGLSLTGSVVSGIPTTKNLVGTTFPVTAEYKTKTASANYTLVVNGNVLKAIAVSAGVYHSCAITPTNGLKCWGLNDQGQLGSGNGTSSIVPVNVVGMTSQVASVSVGIYHTCATKTDGSAWCWGINDRGQLGIGNSGFPNSATPVQVSGMGSGVSKVVTGYDHVCAVHNGAAKCWGGNGRGAVGNNTVTDQFSPVVAGGLASGITDVGAGGDHSCALLSNGTVKCWGWNVVGQLGNNSVVDSLTPVNVIGLTGAGSISIGYNHSCALTSSGVKCWGHNDYGALGDGSANTSLTPVLAAGTSGATRVSAGGYHTCAVVSGQVKCWGYNIAGQVGTGSYSDVLVPTVIPGITDVESGYFHTCGLSAEGAACWGFNDNSQLGDKNTVSQPAPVDVEAD